MSRSAMRFVERSAQHGNVEAQLQLGKLYHLGNQTSDCSRSRSLLCTERMQTISHRDQRRGCREVLPSRRRTGLVCMYVCTYVANHVAVVVVVGVGRCIRAVALRCASGEAKFLLALAFQEGNGVPKKLATAIEWFGAGVVHT